MIRSLIRKELRALQPFIVLLVFLAIVDFVSIAITEFPDDYGILRWFSDSPLTGNLIVYAVIAYALAQGVLMRERAEDTLEFLDALPVTRHHVFWTKFIAALFVLVMMVLVDTLLFFGFHAWARESHTPELYPHFWWPRLVILLLMTFVYLSIGLLASFIGRFGLILIFFVLLGVFFLRQIGQPFADLIDPFAVGKASLDGTRLILPWQILQYQLAIGGGCLLFAWIAFLRLGMPRPKGGFWRRAAMPVFICCCLGLFAAWCVIMVAFSDNDEPVTAAGAGTTDPIYPSYQTTRARNDDFVFIYPNDRAGKAEQLISSSMAVHDTVLQFLGAERRNDLVVDLTSTSPRHAGTAYWKRIRMNLDAGETSAELDAILGHELTHVYIDQMSDDRVSDNFNATRFFHEGLASYIEYRFFREPGDLNNIRRLAAVAYDRDYVDFATVIDSAALAGRYTGEWVYPLGEVFVAGVIERFGDDAPRNLVRAFAREDAPKNLTAMPLWQDTFQACGYNIEEAIAAFFELLDREAKTTQRKWLDHLPHLGGQVVRREDEIGVRISRHDSGNGSESLNPEHLVVRFRSIASEPESQYLSNSADERAIVWIPAEHFQRGSFWYQIGYRNEDLMFPIFDPWVRSKVPSQ